MAEELPRLQLAEQVVRESLEVVQRVSPPEDLREAALHIASKVIMGQTSLVELTAPRNPSSHSTAQDSASPEATLAAFLEVDPAVIMRLYDFRDDEVRFEGNPSILGTSKAEMAANIALLIVAGRQGSKRDATETSDKTIRDELSRHGLYDRTNYTKHLARLKSFISTYGKGQGAVHRLRYDGRIRAKELLLLYGDRQ